MRKTGISLLTRYKYPGLVSYNKLTWKMLAADAPEVHETAAPHYAQMLSLAATTDLPHILNDFHLDIPEEQWLSALPSSLYILPGVASAMGNDPKEFGPYGWPFQHVTDSTALQYYAPVEAAVGASISDVITYKSPDLRIICNAVVFRPGAKVGYSPNSTFDRVAKAAGADAPLPDFVLFHFFRPNRPTAELSFPLRKYFRHPLALPSAATSSSSSSAAAASPVDIFGLNSKWEPLLDQPATQKRAPLSAPKAFRPPTSYLPGLYERLAIKPGDAFGKRSLMWGSYF